MHSEHASLHCSRMCRCTHFYLSHPCFSLDAKHKPLSCSIYIAVPVKMGFHSIPSVTLNTLPSFPCPHCLIPCTLEHCTTQDPCHQLPAPQPSYWGHLHCHHWSSWPSKLVTVILHLCRHLWEVGNMPWISPWGDAKVTGWSLSVGDATSGQETWLRVPECLSIVIYSM